MPLLEQHQPRLAKLLGRTAEIFRYENEYMERVAQAWLEKEIIHAPGDSFELSISSFLELPVALRRRAARQLIGLAKNDLRRIGWDHIESIQTLAQADKPQAVLKFPGGLEVRRTYDRLAFLKRRKKKAEAFSYALEAPGDYKIKEIGRILSIEEIVNRRGLHLRGPAPTAYLDADKLRFPLTVRTFNAGDRFIPFGMKGHKKLKDFFVNLKVPMEQRRATPLLCCDDAPVWICGFRIDDRFKITPGTKRVLKVTLR
jgi:tRNA(Ile)-lysidine synthase